MAKCFVILYSIYAGATFNSDGVFPVLLPKMKMSLRSVTNYMPL